MQGMRKVGRREQRSITISRMLRDYVDCPYPDHVFRLERQVKEQGKTTVEVRFGITSAPPSFASAHRLLEVARAEWGIENGLHYRRDVALEADRCQVRRGRAPQVLAVLNHAVIGIVLRTGERNLAAAQRAFIHAFDRLLARRAVV